ncbi:MAG TPA: hypothetical protein PKH71_05620, partial [Methanoregulaceae archaeon]|nr:hypothetical protein [Methanoregulaceae archaeon]
MVCPDLSHAQLILQNELLTNQTITGFEYFRDSITARRGNAGILMSGSQESDARMSISSRF